MCDFDAKRRKFLAQSLTTLGIMMLPFPRSWLALAAGTTGRRQHLINIIDNGGWEASYNLNYMDPSLQDELSTPPADYSDLNLLRYGSASTAGIDKVLHPSGAGLAPGMKFWSASDFNKFMIIRGLQAIAGHNQHQFIYGGGTSPYMASFSAIVAGYQADTRGPSPLHYVKLANGTRTWIHSGMMTGLAIPSLMPDNSSWKTLTTPRVSDEATKTNSSILEAGIADLGKAASAKLTRDAAKGVVSGYMSGYSSSVLLSNSNYANSAEFLTIWLRYFDAFKKEASDHLASGYGVIGDLKSDKNQQGLSESGFVNLFTPISKAALTTSTIANPQTGSVEFARSVAWKYAMAEFLIVKDLSAVVDLSPSGFDSHNAIISPGFQTTIAMAGMRELVRKLAATPNPDGGGMLLDCTLVTYGSEFERDGSRWATNQGGWGTNHGSTFSMLMAGHRSNMGKIFGSVTQGEQAAGIYKGQYGRAIPFSPTTGEIGVGGVSAYSIFPTVLTMMGVPIPLQQVTDSKSVPVFIKA